MPAAVGTSLLVIAINSAAALATRLGTHVHLDWPLLALFALAALAGTLAGNQIASRLDAVRLTAAFAVLLIAVAAYSLSRSLPGCNSQPSAWQPAGPARPRLPEAKQGAQGASGGTAVILGDAERGGHIEVASQRRPDCGDGRAAVSRGGAAGTAPPRRCASSRAAAASSPARS